MNRFVKKAMAAVMAVMCVASATSVTAFAASTNVDSIGSVAADYQTTGTNPATSNTAGITGYDDTQDRESEYAQYSADTTATTNVYATQASTFSVLYPVVLVMDGAAGQDHQAVGTVQVKGNIAGDEYISVVPAETFALSQEGKDDVTATVTQNDQYFCVEGSTAIATLADKTFVNTVTPDFADTTTTVTLNADDASLHSGVGISAGIWSGSYNTTIALNPVA